MKNYKIDQPTGVSSEGSALGSGILLQGDDGTDRTNVLVDTAGHLQVDVLSGGGGGTLVIDNEVVDGADTGILVLGTDGSNYQIMAVDSSGHLQVDVLSGGGAGTQYTEDVAAAADPVGGTIVMTRDDQLSAVTEAAGDWSRLRGTAKGALWVALADASGDPITSFGGGTEYTEDVATANPQVGKAIMMERDDALTTVTPVEGDWVGTRGTAEGALWTQDFNSDAILSDTSSIDGKITACNTGAVTVSAALPAGTNNVGKVNVEKNTGTLSPNNSTTTPLGIDAVFTGTSDEVKDYAALNVSVFADQVSATDGLSLEWSQDGTNWDEKMTVSLAASKVESYEFGVRARYFRIVYTNGGIAQGAFRLQTMYHPARTRQGARCLCVDVDSREFAPTRRAVIAGQKPNNDYTNIQATASGNLKIAIEEFDATLIGGGVEASALRVTLANDSTGLVSIDDGGGTITVDGTVTANLSATDNAVLDVIAGDTTSVDGKITACNTGAVVLAAGTAGIGKLTANTGVDIGDVTINNAGSAAAVNIQDGGNTITIDGTVTANLSATDNAVLDNIDTDTTTIASDTTSIDGKITACNTGAVVLAAGTASVGDITIRGNTNANGSGSDVWALIDAAGHLQIDVISAPSTAVTGTFWQATQPISGTVTANLGATDNGVLDNIDSNTDYGAVVGGGAEATALRVTIANNSTGVLSIDDGGNTITVDGTVTANLSATDNAVLDTIDAVLDAIKTDTEAIETAVEGTLTVDLGANNDVTVTSGSIDVLGDTAHDAADSGDPVKIGHKAVLFNSSAPPNAVAAENDRVNSIADEYGRQYVETTHPNYWDVSADYAGAQTNATVKAAPGASLSLYLTDIVISNGATAGNITLLDGSGGTVLIEIYPAINGGLSTNLRTPIKLTANTLLAITSTSVTTHSVTASGFIAP